jgi:curved DNA-binding protein
MKARRSRRARPAALDASVPATGPAVRARVPVSLQELYEGAVRDLAARDLQPDAGVAGAGPLRLRIPKGTVDGELLPLTTHAGESAGFAEVRLQPHALFRTDGRDVLLDLPVAPWEVALDSTLRIPTLGGSVDVRVPAGSQDGETIRMPHRGLPGDPPGDQLVRLRVVVPRASTARARALYGDLRRELHFNPRAELYRRAGNA